MLRCVYVDLDAALLGAGGSLVHDAQGRFSLLGGRALETCHRAGAEVVAHSARAADEVAPVAALLGLRAWIAGDGETLVLDGEEESPDGLVAAILRHRRARACPPDAALAVGRDLVVAAAVGAFWLVGAAPANDPLLQLELDRHPNVRLAEDGGGAALYEAVVTTLAESRGRSSSA